MAGGEGELGMDETVIYPTGITLEGKPLIGGIWRMWSQEGFPIESSWMECNARGWKVDWCEAMVDASLTNECPSLMRQVEGFLGGNDVLHMKREFMALVKSGRRFQDILERKKANSSVIEELIRRLE